MVSIRSSITVRAFSCPCGSIVSVEYNAENASGFIKSWDNAYMQTMLHTNGTYPNEYTRYYASLRKKLLKLLWNLSPPIQINSFLPMKLLLYSLQWDNQNSYHEAELVFAGASFFFSFLGAGSAALNRAAISSAERLLFWSLSELLPDIWVLSAVEETADGSFTVSELVLSTTVKVPFLIFLPMKLLLYSLQWDNQNSYHDILSSVRSENLLVPAAKSRTIVRLKSNPGNPVSYSDVSTIAILAFPCRACSNTASTSF